MTAVSTQTPTRYFNRELSWLKFNQRVLEEAKNQKVPLLERVRMLAICGSNLDEFYMVRVAGLKDQERHDAGLRSADGLTPGEQLDAINIEARSLMLEQQQCLLTLHQALKRAGITVCEADALTLQEQQQLKRYFNREIFPVLTPIAIDPAHPFPFIPNLGMSCLYTLSHKEQPDFCTALIQIPPKLPRFVPIHTRKQEPRRFIQIEALIHQHIHTLFPGFKPVAHTLFRIIRDSDLDIEEEAEDLVRSFEKAVKERRCGRVIRVKYAAGTTASQLAFLQDMLQV